MEEMLLQGGLCGAHPHLSLWLEFAELPRVSYSTRLQPSPRRQPQGAAHWSWGLDRRSVPSPSGNQVSLLALTSWSATLS